MALVGATLGFVVAVGIGTGITVWSWRQERPARLLAEARAATDDADWPRAFKAWHEWNQAARRSVATLLTEAQLAQTINRGQDADQAAGRVLDLDPTSTPAWLIRVNRLRVLDRPTEAIALGLAALPRLRTAEQRRTILKATTLAALAEVPDAEARAQLDSWITANPTDLDAQVARWNRIAANPHPGDPDRAARIATLQAMVDRNTEQVAAREALVGALADSGEVERGRVLLTTWPTSQRGPRFERLQARWDLEYDHQTDRAIAGFRRAIVATPHDWRSHYGLARALRTSGQADAASAEALSVARLRERLEPGPLGSRLSTDLDRADAESDPEASRAILDLADLCRSVGLANLADAWTQAATPDPRPDAAPNRR